MAKPKACQTPNAEVTPVSSNQADKLELAQHWEAERCPRDPAPSAVPALDLSPLPFRHDGSLGAGGLGDPPAGGGEGEGLAPVSSPWLRAQTQHLAARRSWGAQGAEQREALGEGTTGLSQDWVHFSTSRLSCLYVGSG